MSQISVKRVFISGRSYYFVYVRGRDAGILTHKPTKKELQNLIEYKGWNEAFVRDSLTFLNGQKKENTRNDD